MLLHGNTVDTSNAILLYGKMWHAALINIWQ